MGIIWLASYPKSGNTWIRFLLYNYLYGPVRKTEDVEARMGGVRSAAPVAPGGVEPVFRKTHLLFNEQHPCVSETQGFVYVLRHPKDVLLSNLNYFRLCGGQGINDREFALDFIKNMGVGHWRDTGRGSWPEHAQSWLAQPRYPHVFLRYEEMQRDPRAALRQVIETLAIPLNEMQLNRAVHLSSFAKMRTLEETEKKKKRFNAVFAGAPETDQAGFRFMNEGRSGKTLLHLGEDVESLFNERFREVLANWGYGV